MTDTPGTYLIVFENDGSRVTVDPSHEPSLDAAVTAWLHEHRDNLIHLTLLDGDKYVTLASNISGWSRSTEEGRRRSAEIEAESKLERRGHRADVGLSWEDEE